jgi:predicted MPP superfamily phosphohydrolase
MKKILYVSGIIVFLVLAYLIVLDLYPKNAGRFPFFALLFLGDLYLWNSVKAWINSKKRLIRYVLPALYWSSFVLLLALVGFSMVFTENDWNNTFKIYSFGFVFVVYASKLLPILFLLFADVIRLLRYINMKAASVKKGHSEKFEGKKISRAKFLQDVGLISGGILFSGLITGMFKWAYEFKIKRHMLNISQLPKSFDGLKIVQISDIHLGSWAGEHQLKDAVNLINGLNPDLVFFTGDLVNYKTDEAFRFENILSKIKSRHGVFATLGNHDYGDYTRWPSVEAKIQNMTDLFDFYKRMGWKLLRNENELIRQGEDSIAVIGVENWGDFSRFPKYGDIAKASLGTENAPVKLLLSHDPTHWEKIISQENPDIDITFAGHTHGFQFGIEIKNIKWSPAKYIYKHWAGLYENTSATAKPQFLYVNRGLGNIGYPGRIGILPEITLFELKTA